MFFLYSRYRIPNQNRTKVSAKARHAFTGSSQDANIDR
jgi:hypothetical protein